MFLLLRCVRGDGQSLFLGDLILDTEFMFVMTLILYTVQCK